MKCRLIQNENYDVFFNLAVEHSLIQTAAEFSDIPVIRIWRNTKSVILGRGQNVRREINEEFCIENGIQIARRISGGGAVYHDLGNINLSFFLSPQIKKQMNISDLPSIACEITSIIRDSLEIMGYLDVEIESNSNILYRGKKISGSAGYLYKGWNLHHATLLTSADLSMLNGSLLVRDLDPVDKKQSRYFETINLPNFDEKKWVGSLLSVLSNKFKIEVTNENINQVEVKLAHQLVNSMYKQKKWIFESKRKN